MVLNVSKSVFVSIRFPSFLILNCLQAVTPCCLRYSVMFSSVSFLSILSRIIAIIKGFMFRDSDIYTNQLNDA